MTAGGSDDRARALRETARALLQVAARLDDLAEELDSDVPSAETLHRTPAGSAERVIDLADDTPDGGTTEGGARVVAEELVGW